MGKRQFPLGPKSIHRNSEPVQERGKWPWGCLDSEGNLILMEISAETFAKSLPAFGWSDYIYMGSLGHGNEYLTVVVGLGSAVATSQNYVDRSQPRKYYFIGCEHQYVEKGRDPSRGFHKSECRICGYAVETDSSD